MKKLLLKTMLLLCALVAGTSMSWADDVVLYYTLDGTTTGGSNGYATESEITQDGMTWSVTGNTTTNPWRIGGKNLSEEDREAYATTAMGSAITKVELVVGSATLTVNSISLIVASDAGFTSVIDEITKNSPSVGTTHTFTPSSGTEWAKAAYYKFVFNVTAGSSNQYVQFTSAKFYKAAAAVKTDPTITFNNGSVKVGSTLDLSTLFDSDSEGAVTYSITSGDSYASISGSTLTGEAAGSVTVKAEQAAYGDYNAGEASATITVSNPALSSIAISTEPTKTTYNEGETFDATGMVVTATFDDASTEDVTASCTFTPSGALTTSDTEITVSYTRNAVTKTATQAITVNTYVQPTDITVSMNYVWLGSSNGANLAAGSLPVVKTQDNVTITITDGTSTRPRGDSDYIRIYNGSTMTFEAPSGYNITEIEFTTGGSNTWNAPSPDSGDLTGKIWTGDASSVEFSFSGSCFISSATITIAVPSSVETPTFTVAAGTYTEAQNVKVGNYDSDYMYFYTTDGTEPDCDAYLDPTGTSVVYEHATGIDISATTTLKIIAVDGLVNKSSVASATYTIETPLATIAAVKALSSGDTFSLNLTGAQVVFIDGAKKNIYVRDASGAIVLFNKDGFTTTLTTGDILSGVIEGQYSPYNGLPEIVNIADISVLTATDNSTVVAKVITGTTAAIAANLCDLVKIEGTEITERSSKYYVGESSDIQLYDNFKVGYTVTTGKTVDVSGIATVYNTTYELFPRFESDIVYLDESEEIEISAAGVATFCSANALDFTAVDAIKVYTAKVEGGVVKLSQIHKVPAYEGVILMNALGMNEGAVDAVNVPYLDGDADNVSGNELVGITAATVVNAMSAGKYNYILSNETAGVGFYRAVDGVQLAANKAYLSTTVNAAVRDFLGFTEDDSDAIIEIAKNEKMSAIYDLSGRRVVKPTKGLYIVNGKKVVK